MPVKVEYTIGKKRRGNWRCPLDFRITFEGEELELRPHFVFQREYPLPEPIVLGRSPALEKREVGECRSVSALSYHIDQMIDSDVQPQSCIRLALSWEACWSRCSECRAYLPWRPGKPDYSDFEEVFFQVAMDMAEAWEKAVAEAEDSEELDAETVVLSSDDFKIMRRKEVTELAQAPSRKLRIT